MNWQLGTILVVAAAFIVPLLFAKAADRFGTTDDWDSVADQKRRTGKRARQQSGEFQEPRL